MLRERAAHRLESRGVAQPQGREGLAQLAEGDVTLVLVGGRHAADCTIVAASVAMLMRDTSPATRRIPLWDRTSARRSWRVTRRGASPRRRAGAAISCADRAASWRVTPRVRDPRIG
jgi:hypothetical protein